MRPYFLVFLALILGKSLSGQVPYDLTYHRLEWEIRPSSNRIQGAVTTFFVPLDSGFHAIHFDLEASLRVDSVKQRGQGLIFRHSSAGKLEIDLPATLPQGSLDSVTVWYQGTPSASGLGSFIQSAHGSSVSPIIWTLSAPFGAWEWWPCKQSLTDKIDSVDIIVRTSIGNRVAANGVLIAEYTDGNRRVFHWRHRSPIATYLVGVAVTNYAAYSDFVPLRGDTLEVLNYVYPEDLTDARIQTPEVIPIMQFFDSLLGPYPFMGEKYGHAQFGWGGGMEHQTMSFMGSFNRDLIAHELSHQWFGNKVTCGSFEDTWLNEGFATYLTGLTQEFLRGPAAWQNWKQSKHNNVTSSGDGSVRVQDSSNVGAVYNGRLVYDKGALLAHMLRWVVGDSAFFAGLRNYLDDPRYAYGFAYTRDLQAVMEAASGRDLEEFFLDWYQGEGYPTYYLGWQQIGDSLRMNLYQTQSHPSVSFFEMPVPLLLKGTSKDTLIRIDHQFTGQKFSIQVSFPVKEIEIDPELWLISSGNQVNHITTSLDADFGQLEMTVFPNPAKEFLDVQLAKEKAFILKAQLIDSAGRRVWLQTFEKGQRSSIRIPLQGLPGGSYTLLVESDKGMGMKGVEVR